MVPAQPHVQSIKPIYGVLPYLMPDTKKTHLCYLPLHEWNFCVGCMQEVVILLQSPKLANFMVYIYIFFLFLIVKIWLLS
jgi:hypothetical protein